MDHKFKKDKKYKSNEEIFKLSDDEIIPGPTINDDLERLNHKCCRLAFLLNKEKICKVYRVHGEAIEIWDNTGGSNEETGMPPEPQHGWEMDEPEEGYPCTALGPDGCTFEAWEKPWRCQNFPGREKELHLIATCSFKFNPQGKRSGDCDGCAAALVKLYG